MKLYRPNTIYLIHLEENETHLVFRKLKLNNRNMGYIGPRMDQVKFLKDFLPQFLLGPLLNTLSHIM